MTAPPLTFRFRYLLHVGIFALGLFAPWDRWLHLDGGQSTWLTLAGLLGRSGWISFSSATALLLLVAITLATLAAAVRSWASAFLGAAVVQDSRMQGTTVITSGPYGFVRNPLYLGLDMHALALALLMPPSGAAFSLSALAVLQWQLIHDEQIFLAQTLGERYQAYQKLVPSLVPRPKPQPSSNASHPQWRGGLMGEIYMWGAAISFLLLGWRYNALLIEQGLLVSFGLSLVMRAIMPAQTTSTPAIS